MKCEDKERREQIALFRYGVIADLSHLPRGKGSGLYDKLREKSERDCRFVCPTSATDARGGHDKKTKPAETSAGFSVGARRFELPTP